MQVVCIVLLGIMVTYCFHVIQDGDHIHQSEDMSMDLRNITTMMKALCKAEGIDISSITGEVDDHSLSPSTQYTTLETSLDSYVSSESIES
jgi:hypothetical protein